MKALRTLLVMLSLVAGGLAAAQSAEPTPKADAAKADVAKADPEGFVPVTPGENLGPGEVLPGANLVGYAYGFILAALVVWVASVAMRSRKVEEELAALRTKIEKAGK